MNIKVRRFHVLVLTAAIVVVAGLGLSLRAGSASATAPIEGVWSFNGGRIAITAEGSEFAGTVVAPTKFAQCTHAVGEEIWTSMTRQPDGSYWGNHQWFFNDQACTPNPEQGLSAWRVLDSSGGHLLRVCLSEPGSPSQPEIAVDGTVTGATFGCVDSALIASVADISSQDPALYVKFPASSGGCLGRKLLRVRIRSPKNDPIAQVKATVRSAGILTKAKVVRTKKGAQALIHPRNLAGDHFVVQVSFTTVLGQHLHTKHSYDRCPVGKKQSARKHHRLR